MFRTRLVPIILDAIDGHTVQPQREQQLVLEVFS